MAVALLGLDDIIEWPVFLSSDEVDELVVVGEGLEDLSADLSWTDDSREFDDERSTLPHSTTETELRFDLAGLPAWSGEQRWMRLRWSRSRESASRILAIRAEKATVTQEQLQDWLPRAHPISLAGRRELGYRLLRGGGFDLTIDVQDEAKLVLLYGLEPGVRGPVTFEVRERGAPATPLLADTVQSSGVDRGTGWKETVLDLGPWAGQTLELSIVVGGENPLDPTRGLPAIVEPRLAIVEPRLAIVEPRLAAEGSRSRFDVLQLRPVDWNERSRHHNQSRAESPARTLEVR